MQYTCEVRSVPATNPNRFPVVFSIRTAITAPPPTTSGGQVLLDPIIATLTYFRNEVPVMLLFNALGMQDVDHVCALIHRTCHHWADRDQLRRLVYSTTQHSAAVRTREDALSVLHRCMQQHVASNQGGGAMRAVPPSGADGLVAAEELLNANLLPHLTQTHHKTEYLAHMVGILLNHMFWDKARRTQVYDKDFMGNKRIDVCGTLLAQQIRNALYRMRGFVERNLAKAMTCNSQLAQAVRDLPNNVPKSVASVQASVISYFEAHQISKFIAYAMSTGNWSTNAHPGHAMGNSMAAAVAIKTGVIRPKPCFGGSKTWYPTTDQYEPAVRPVSHPAGVHTVGPGGSWIAAPSSGHPSCCARMDARVELHVSHYGFLCPVETPEGPACGLIDHRKHNKGEGGCLCVYVFPMIPRHSVSGPG